MLLALAVHLTDEAKLDRMVPYVVELLQDDSPLVRSAAARTLLQIVCLLYYDVIVALTSYTAHACDRNHSVKRIYLSGVHHTSFRAFAG